MANTVFNQSSRYTGISWGATKIGSVRALGSDMWHSTIAHDGNIYAMWGDGWGFGTGQTASSKSQWGLSRIEGATAAAASGYNVYGGQNAESSEVPKQPTAGDQNWKVGALFCVSSILYAVMFGRDHAPPADGSYMQMRMLHSHDLGQQWRMTNQASVDLSTWDVSSMMFGGAQGYPYFAQMGNNHELNTSSGYIHGMWVSSNSDFYCCRAEIAAVNSWYGYRIRTGSGTWIGSVGGAEKMFTHAFVDGEYPDMTYLASQSRWFITFTPHSASLWSTCSPTANIHILDAPDPWGPWTKVTVNSNFIDTNYKFSWQIKDKWVNTATNEFDMFWSGLGAPQDDFCTTRGTFNLTSPPSSGGTESSSWSTYTGSQSWVKEVDGADIADATVSHLAIFDQIVAGQIAAGAIGAQEIAAGTIVASHIVVGGINGATIISSGTITTDQIGVNELIAHTANIKDAIVTTLKIGLNQVTVPAMGMASNSVSIAAAGSLNLVEVSATLHGQPVFIHGYVEMGTQANPGYITFAVYRDDNTTPLWFGEHHQEYGGVATMAFSVLDPFTGVNSGSPGSRTYTLYGSPVNASNWVRSRNLTILEVQR